MKLFDEALLEPLVRKLRFWYGIKYLDKTTPFSLVDLGCGPKIHLYQELLQQKYLVKKYIGFDPLGDFRLVQKDIELRTTSVDKTIPLADNSVDYVVGFAFLEHIENPELIIRESMRILKPGGKAIFTAPSVALKPILELLAKIGLISSREIAEHKHYFSYKRIMALVPKAYQAKVVHSYFQFGLNNLLVISK